jgi:Brp/Blh family beta-carotene 15,15'-monooxygenase
MTSSTCAVHAHRHSWWMTSLALVCWVLFFNSRPDQQSIVPPLVCFALIVLLGLPHGGLDHRVGARLLKRWSAGAAGWWFVSLYLTISMLIVIGWFFSPLIIILLFFVFSAWHFGLEEETDPPDNWLRSLSSLVRGGMVIWVPCIFQGDRVVELLQITIPVDQTSAAVTSVSWIVKLWPFWIALLICDLWLFGRQSAERGAVSAAKLFKIRWTHATRIIAFGLLFASVDPLIGFTLYFCFWHSVRGLVELRRHFADNWASLIRQLLPMSLAAMGLFVVTLTLWVSGIGWADAAIRTSFIGLSAVAIPHLLLHVFDRLAGQTDLPFSAPLTGEGAV